MAPTNLAATLLVAGMVYLLLAIKTLIKQRRIIGLVPSSNVTVQLPTRSDEGEISEMLQRHQEQPAVLAKSRTIPKYEQS